MQNKRTGGVSPLPTAALLALTICAPGSTVAQSYSPAPVAPAQTQAPEGESAYVEAPSIFETLVKDGNILLNARLRYSFASFGTFEENANGITYRIRAGFQTGAVFDTKALIDFDHIRSPLEEFNSTINGLTQFPVVADPDATELNRLQISNKSLPDTTITLGRQRIIHDDARFIGNVGWRQNEQTFDALRVQNSSVPGLSLEATYVDQVNRIFGDDSPQGRFESDSVFIRSGYEVPTDFADISLRAFAYLLDFESDEVPALTANLSTETYGFGILAARGPAYIEGVYANQTPFAGNPGAFNVNYYTVAGGIKKYGFHLKAGYEVLGGDGTFGFATPLATAHKFNGFADVFLVTPAFGLEDLYIQGSYSRKDVGPFQSLGLTLFYHEFEAEEGNQELGDEFDLIFTARPKLAKRILFLIKFADFTASDGFAQDVQRLTVETNFKF